MNPETTDRLRAISDGYSDGLKPATRARILASARQSARSTSFATPFAHTLPRMLAAAAVVVVLALPALHLRPWSGRAAGHGTADATVKDLQVVSQDGQVVLTWKDGDQPRRVVRATSREELARMSQLPAQTVSGERWVDEHPNDAAVVFYLVE